MNILEDSELRRDTPVSSSEHAVERIRELDAQRRRGDIEQAVFQAKKRAFVRLYLQATTNS